LKPKRASNLERERERRILKEFASEEKLIKPRISKEYATGKESQKCFCLFKQSNKRANSKNIFLSLPLKIE